MNISIAELSHYVEQSCLCCGLSQEDSHTVMEVYMRATLRGMGHHDINDFPGRIDAMLSGRVNVVPQFRRLSEYKG